MEAYDKFRIGNYTREGQGPCRRITASCFTVNMRFNPIPLSAEVMRMMGFELSDEWTDRKVWKQVRNGYDFEAEEVIIDKQFIITWFPYFTHRFVYLHQLQNYIIDNVIKPWELVALSTK